MEDSSGRPGIPLRLNVLAVLQILGRGNRFDDIQELSGMPQSRAQSTFHHFCRCFVRDVYAKWIYVPEGKDLEVMRMYEAVEFPGAVGSSDVTHVRWERAPTSEGVHYMGKEGLVTVAYQVTVDHTGFAQGVMTRQSCAGAQACGLEYTEKGACIKVSGGYHKWRCTICPFKASITQAQANSSERMESVGKDVECFLGRTKGRWRILKLPLQYWHRKRIDNILFHLLHTAKYALCI
ncbi:unnamed protein product [Discosporangium mesarthrocarpum]